MMSLQLQCAAGKYKKKLIHKTAAEIQLLFYVLNDSNQKFILITRGKLQTLSH
jgi:hypothetical protein